jgi:hypothetical protein
MYEVIPENLAEILAKRLFLFLALFIVATVLIYFHQSITTYPTFNAADDLNKTDIVFSFLN